MNLLAGEIAALEERLQQRRAAVAETDVVLSAQRAQLRAQQDEQVALASVIADQQAQCADIPGLERELEAARSAAAGALAEAETHRVARDAALGRRAEIQAQIAETETRIQAIPGAEATLQAAEAAVADLERQIEEHKARRPRGLTAVPRRPNDDNGSGEPETDPPIVIWLDQLNELDALLHEAQQRAAAAASHLAELRNVEAQIPPLRAQADAALQEADTHARDADERRAAAAVAEARAMAPANRLNELYPVRTALAQRQARGLELEAAIAATNSGIAELEAQRSGSQARVTETEAELSGLQRLRDEVQREPMDRNALEREVERLTERLLGLRLDDLQEAYGYSDWTHAQFMQLTRQRKEASASLIAAEQELGQVQQTMADGDRAIAEAEAALKAHGAARPVPAVSDAVFVSQSVPDTIKEGASAAVSITLRNQGNVNWTAAAGYCLGFQDPQGNVPWGTQRVGLPHDVMPGQAVSFNFAITAPQPGHHGFQWRMLRETVAWFGEETPWLRIRVVPLLWSERPSGTFAPGSDIIEYVIEQGAVPADSVEFVLQLGGQVTWKKILNIPDGEGSNWDIIAEGRDGRAWNGLWAHQVHNGQVLTFKKAGFLGIITDVFQLGDLGGLQPSSRVTFYWVKD